MKKIDANIFRIIIFSKETNKHKLIQMKIGEEMRDKFCSTAPFKRLANF